MKKLFFLSIDSPTQNFMQISKRTAFELINKGLVCKWIFIDSIEKLVGFGIYAKKR